MQTVAIAGVGLIGGSFALALRRAGFNVHILGVSSPTTIAEALELGIIDEGVDLESACARADLLYLAQPIGRILQLLQQIGPLARPGLLVTDAGSTKARIMEGARRFLPPGTFLGGHPIAGKEARGAASAEGSIFEGRPYVLTPDDPETLKIPPMSDFVACVEAIGARPVVLGAEEHDHILAYTSHLPQLLSTSLACVVDGIEKAPDVAGPAVLELTRLALSPFEIWRDILLTNQASVISAIDALTLNLQNLKHQIGTVDLDKGFAQGASSAKRLRKNNKA